jgi:hypothetical protein
MSQSLINIQQELKAPKGQKNSFGGYKYRSCEDILEAVKPLLKKEKVYLNISDEVIAVLDRVYVKATASLRGDDGNLIEQSTAMARESLVRKGQDDSQITGTASSYARKYALNGLFAIDDTKDADTDEYAKKTKPKVAVKPTKGGNQDLEAKDLLSKLEGCKTLEELTAFKATFGDHLATLPDKEKDEIVLKFSEIKSNL